MPMSRFALSLVAVAAAAVSGCNVSSNDGNSGNVSIKGDGNGSVSFNVPFVNGRVKLPDDALKGGNFDIDGVKMIPGATLTGFNVNAGDQGSTVHMAFNAPKTPDEVRAYFMDQFRQKGVAVVQSGTAVKGKTEDGDTFAIDVQPAAQGSAGTIAIQSRD